MADFRLTRKAVEDLTRIWHYTLAKWSKNQAEKYYKMLIEAFGEVAMKPEMGKDYSHVRENVWGLKAGRHIIFYRKNAVTSRIEITRILHERMDLKSRIE